MSNVVFCVLKNKKNVNTTRTISYSKTLYKKPFWSNILDCLVRLYHFEYFLMTVSSWSISHFVYIWVVNFKRYMMFCLKYYFILCHNFISCLNLLFLKFAAFLLHYSFLIDFIKRVQLGLYTYRWNYIEKV